MQKYMYLIIYLKRWIPDRDSSEFDRGSGPVPLRTRPEVKACSVINLVWSHALGRGGVMLGDIRLRFASGYASSSNFRDSLQRAEGFTWMQARVIIDHATSLLLCWRGALGKRSLLRWDQGQAKPVMVLVFWPEDAERAGVTLMRGNIYGGAWFGWPSRRLSIGPSSFRPIAVHCVGHSGSL